MEYILQKLGESGITVNKHPTKPLWIFNYDMIEAKKDNKMACECRGLVLEVGTWNIVAKAFTRFFNLHEIPSLNFKWNDCSIQEKVDGSLILIFKYDGEIFVNTRNSWGDGLVNNSTFTWRTLVEQGLSRDGLILESLFDSYNPPQTYVMELCSPYNMIVRRYNATQVYLLSAFNDSEEYSVQDCNYLAEGLGLKRPKVYELASAEAVEEWLKENAVTDPTFEGFVCRDKNDTRVKVKSAAYVNLHHLRGNGNIFLPQYMVPLVLNGEIDEAISYFEDLIPKANEMKEILNTEFSKLMTTWEEVKNIQSQKDFALAVLDKSLFPAILFTARKMGICPSKVWKESADLLVKVLFKN